MITTNASNWVDRGEPAGPKVASVVRHLLGFDVPVTDEQLAEYAETLLGMVAADASEIDVASYVGHIEERHGRPRSDAKQRRLRAIAIWHIAKAAMVRDRAMRLLEMPDAAPPDSLLTLEDVLAARLVRHDETQ